MVTEKALGGINVSIKDVFGKKDKKDCKSRSTGGLISYEKIKRILAEKNSENEAKLKDQEVKLIERVTTENETKLKEHETKLEERMNANF